MDGLFTEEYRSAQVFKTLVKSKVVLIEESMMTQAEKFPV
jgi:hypothetical protein